LVKVVDATLTHFVKQREISVAATTQLEAISCNYNDGTAINPKAEATRNRPPMMQRLLGPTAIARLDGPRYILYTG